MAEVVVVPGAIMCPSCSHVVHGRYTAEGPVPQGFKVKCLNRRCPEYGVFKMVPLQRVNVEVCDAEPE